jgi:hypothetical protein
MQAPKATTDAARNYTDTSGGAQSLANALRRTQHEQGERRVTYFRAGGAGVSTAVAVASAALQLRRRARRDLRSSDATP